MPAVVVEVVGGVLLVLVDVVVGLLGFVVVIGAVDTG
ncbi:hypothetical protein ABIB25_002229 [Nakamurella sp. UYEF19]